MKSLRSDKGHLRAPLYTPAPLAATLAKRSALADLSAMSTVYRDIEDFLHRTGGTLAKGPLALVFAEDGAELAGTLRHHLAAGFRQAVLFAPEGLALPADLPDAATVVRHDTLARGAVVAALNRVIGAVPEGTWLYWGYNAEYLFHPFAETRSVAEMLAFHTEERRAAMLTSVIDLYPGDLTRHPGGVAVEDAWFDRAGYYALPRTGPDGVALDRQVDIFGGLRWRFEEHVPPERRRIDRIALFRTRQGLQVLPDLLLNEAELNTHACAWHHNLTAAVASFRAAKALASNPGSRRAIAQFRWSGSERFEWQAQQLMGLGMMEPGQWF